MLGSFFVREILLLLVIATAACSPLCHLNFTRIELAVSPCRGCEVDEGVIAGTWVHDEALASSNWASDWSSDWSIKTSKLVVQTAADTTEIAFDHTFVNEQRMKIEVPDGLPPIDGWEKLTILAHSSTNDDYRIPVRIIW
jgi:hypothetical protein